MHAICDGEFAGSHLCHSSEFGLAASTTTRPTDGAWLDMACGVSGSSFMASQDIAAVDTGSYTDFQNYTNCGNWTSAYASHLGVAIIPEEITGSGQNCDEFKPVACCE